VAAATLISAAAFLLRFRAICGANVPVGAVERTPAAMETKQGMGEEEAESERLGQWILGCSGALP
jgi:hypothetical protein